MVTHNIEQIGHSDANIEWSSDEDLDWVSGIKNAFEVFRTLFFLKLFRTWLVLVISFSSSGRVVAVS